MRRRIEVPVPAPTRSTRGVARAALCACALLVVGGGGSALAAGNATFTGAKAPAQTDTVKSGGVAAVAVGCPKLAVKHCSGKLVLKSDKPVKQGKTKSVITFGSASFTIASGKTTRVQIKLSNEAVKLLKSHGKLTPIATATSHDGAGRSAKTTAKITLKKKGGHSNPPPSALY